MAAQIGAGKDFKYQNVQIFKTQPLGIGSYGSVYRAKCDQLPCAAKLLHPVLVNPWEQRNLQRFEQECQFVSGIRHPHIVQYLGTCRDTDSGLPVLLMELMDDSLTHFLEESPERLPYHLEVNLCHDVALALAYLHSNGIIHRDLSSNNVLLIAGSRAKVTDFGMSKLLDTTPRMTPLTQCPGTIAYMSPEATREPPMYTNKLDCFAHGVVAIQIMTRQFPDPGPASHLVDDSRSPTGTISMPVLEPERRKSHIDRINPNHPLLPIAIQCLSYNERDRPSAQQICHQLGVLKETPLYVHSLQQAQGRGRLGRISTADMEAKDGRIAELQRSMAVCEWEIRELQEQIQGKEEQLREKDATVVTSQLENQRLRQELDQTTRDKQRFIQENQRLTQGSQRLTQGSQRLRQELDQAIQDSERLTRDNQRLTRDLRDRDQQIEEKERQLRDNEQIIAEFQQTLLQKEKAMRGTIEVQPVHQQMRPEASNPAKDGAIRLSWKECPKAPCEMYGEQATADGNTAYFSESGHMYSYDSKEKWSELPECPQKYGSLAIVKSLLTAVGGYQSDKPTNTLLSLSRKGSRRKWSEHFPPMPTKRYLTAVVCSGRSLVVAGGTGDNSRKLSTVEVMDTECLQWSTASSLPHPFSDSLATICGEILYILGGFDQIGQSKSVFICSLSALLQTNQPQSLGARLKKSLSLAQQSSVWQKVADIPVYQATCTVLCGHILAVGGRDSDLKLISAIHKYDPVKDSWTVVSHMPTPRCWTLVAVLPGDRLMVVGGQTSYRGHDIVEIAGFAV